MSMLQSALQYAERGWHVFPLAPGTKKPLLGTHGWHDASCDLAKVTEWWSRNPDANIGCSIAPSGFYVLDVDVSGDKAGAISLRALLNGTDRCQFETLEQRTGRGGAHFLFRRDQHASVRLIKFMPGLDLFGHGYILLAPSKLLGAALEGAPHGCDGVYRWERQAEMLPLPDVLVDLLRDEAPRLSAPLPSGDLPPIESGGRNIALYRLAALLRDNGASYRSIHAALLVTNQERCKPPLSEGEVGVIARSAAKNAPTRDAAENAVFADAAIKAVTDALGSEVVEPTPFEQALSVARMDVVQALGVAAASVPVPLFENGLDLLDREIPPTPWLIRRLITQGGTAVVAGPPKTSKTWVLCEAAIALATGSRFMGIYETGAPKRIAYFFAEDHAAPVRNRFVSLCRGRNLDPKTAMKNIFPQPRGRFIDLTKDEDLALIIASCRMIGGMDVVILEPLRDIHSGAESDSDSMGPLMRRIRVIGELLQATVFIAHHMKKGADEPDKKKSGPAGQDMRGSSAIHGSIDSGLFLSDLRENAEGTICTFTNTFTSQVKAARGGGIFDVQLKIEDNPDGTAFRAEWVVAGTRRATSEVEDKLLAIIRCAPEPLSRRKLAEAVGVKRTVAEDLIDSMANRGILVRHFVHPTLGHELDKPVFTEAPVCVARPPLSPSSP